MPVVFLLPPRQLGFIAAFLLMSVVFTNDANAKRRGCQPGGDCKNGFGDMYYTDSLRNGDRYAGGYKDGLRHGPGTYYWWGEKKGQIMAAVWELDQPVGEVLVTYADGSRYEGGWKMRSGREGIGTYFLPDNTHWLAEWSGDQKQGYGILYDSSGRILQESYFHSERGSRRNRLIDPLVFESGGRTEDEKYPTPAIENDATNEPNESGISDQPSRVSSDENDKLKAFFDDR